MSNGYLNYDSIRVLLADATREQLMRKREEVARSTWTDQAKWNSALNAELSGRVSRKAPTERPKTKKGQDSV